MIANTKMKADYYLINLDIKKSIFNNKNKIFKLYEGPNYIGRSIKNDIVLTDKSVSRAHGFIYKLQEEMIYIDLNSRFGSKINNFHISVLNSNNLQKKNNFLRSVSIFSNDHITFGEVSMMVLEEAN